MTVAWRSARARPFGRWRCMGMMRGVAVGGCSVPLCGGACAWHVPYGACSNRAMALAALCGFNLVFFGFDHRLRVLLVRSPHMPAGGARLPLTLASTAASVPRLSQHGCTALISVRASRALTRGGTACSTQRSLCLCAPHSWMA